MYTSYDLAVRIKSRAKECNVVIKEMLSKCDLGSNAMSALYHGKSMNCISLARIADYLDCSVDYLLGRTDIPEVNKRDEEVTVYKVAARGGKKEIKLNAAQRAELERIINEHKDDDNSDLV